MLTSYLLFLPLGAVAGLLAGLLGVGGGLIIVPMISFALEIQGVNTPYNHHIALGTSLATIMFTSVSSFLSHHRKGSVLWGIVIKITPGIFLGTLLGSYFAAHVPVLYLKIFFVIFLFYIAIQMIINVKPKGSTSLPGIAVNSVAGTCIGAVSSLVGIGGGALSVPYLLWCNITIHEAIGTSAAIGFPIALSGTVGYILNGLVVADQLPVQCIGFIYLPALVGIALVSVMTAPLGARLAHKLPVDKLKKIFACLLLVMGIRMVYKLLLG